MATTKVFGKIQFGWGTHVILPVEQAAKLIELVAQGLVRETGSWDDRGYVTQHESGRPLDIPELNVITEGTYHAAIIRGKQHLAEAQEKRAAEEAAEKAKAESQQA